MKFNDMKYVRPDYEALGQKLVDLATKIEEAKEPEAVLSAVAEYLQIQVEVQTMGTLCSIRNSINTVDSFYEEEMKFFNEKGPEFAKYDVLVGKALVNSKFRKEVEAKYTKQFMTLTELSLKVFDEKIIPDLVEEAKLSTEYSKLMAGVRISFDGKENNLSQMGKYLSSSDREVRKAANKAIGEAMETVDAKIDDIMDSLVHVRDTMAHKLGYKNYVELGYLRLSRSDYDAKDVANYRKQVYEDYLPLAKKCIADQEKRLGFELKSYDLPIFYTDGNPDHKKNKEELVSAAYKFYSSLSKETEAFFSHMIEDELMDLEAKPNKAGGGYCTSLPAYKTPFIFSNFNGTMGDVDVLTHEAGHAFEVYTACQDCPVPGLWFPTLEACEIHSMSMEFFAYPYIQYFFTEDDKKYRFKHLSEAITFIPYGVTVDEFQHFLYENPNATKAERKLKWLELERKYTPWKKYDEGDYMSRGNRWQRQGHIFSTAFYYIDYTLAQVCAFQFLLLDRENHEAAWKKYYDLCKLGGSKSFVELLNAVDLKNPFQDGFLASITPKLMEVLKDIEL